ncbi:putative zinc-binding protein [Methanococcus sp. CF]
MVETPKCTCGGPEIAGEKKRIIFSCSGASNVGELSNAAAVELTKEGFGNKVCTASLAIKTPAIMEKVKDADEIVVIDGCPVSCAKRIADNAGAKVDQYVIITELGIKKIGDMDIVDKDLKTTISAVKDGKCVCMDRKRENHQNSGCSCGCESK